MTAGVSERLPGLAIHRLARAWFAELQETQRAIAECSNGLRPDASVDLAAGLLEWLIADVEAGGDGDAND